jgi:hypothetical protein
VHRLGAKLPTLTDRPESLHDLVHLRGFGIRSTQKTCTHGRGGVPALAPEEAERLRAQTPDRKFRLGLVRASQALTNLLAGHTRCRSAGNNKVTH